MICSQPRNRAFDRLVIVAVVCFFSQGFHIERFERVFAAPPQNQNASAIQNGTTSRDVIGGRRGDSAEQKTADLTLLINETLKINNKSAVDGCAQNGTGVQGFRDDWTFERVEYDLMDFLQELNARYQHANMNQSLSDQNGLERRQDAQDSGATNRGISVQTPINPDSSVSEVVTKTTIADLKKELDLSSPVDGHHTQGGSSVTTGAAMGTPRPTTPASSVLPISLASGDHDIAESTWQYGIFDRFTRPRTSTTTLRPSDGVPGSSEHLDVRVFNSDECGLRTYRQEPDYFPVALSDGSQPDTDEISKELSQRRQRPPLGSFFSSHKKFHQTGATIGDNIEGLGEDFGRDRPLDSLPPFDRNGEPAATVVKNDNPSGGASQADPYEGHLPAHESQFPDSEFNLSLRRQWLQQQLDSTLRTLGFNKSHDSPEGYLDKGAGILRENMMKISAAAAAALSRGNKLGRSQNDQEASSDGAKRVVVQSETGEKDELRARQDELKLEARVIGGHDARLGDSPWSVSLQALVARPGTGGVEYRHYCGGTIISEWYILTAAHCLDFMVGRESRLFVVVGDLNWRMSAASMHGRRFGIEKLIIHGAYKSSAFGHDIGLIKTKESMKPLKVNGRYIINSVCLPERNVEHTGEAELVGWGLFSNRNEMADSLQIADVPILPRPLCVDLYRRRTGLIQWLIGIELITEKQVCAGTFGRGICQGDSGSALVFNENIPGGPIERPVTTSTQTASPTSSTVVKIKSNAMRNQQQRATIIGVVAFGGIRRCSYQSLPGVYMQTSKYLDWILPRIRA